MTPALSIDNLSKSFGGLPATRNVSIDILPGERRLIIGPNGAGKTTLFNLITGDLEADAGRIRLFGSDVTALPTHKRAHLGLARTYRSSPCSTATPSRTTWHSACLACRHAGIRCSRRWRAMPICARRR